MSSELKCSICLEFYDSSDKKPRILSCGHSFCESCLIQLENQCCSTCRTEIDLDEPLPVNYGLMGLSENVKKDNNDDEKDICRDHNLPKNCECSTHGTMICAACGMVAHKQCETKFIGEKLSTKKRKFDNEEPEEVRDIYFNSVEKIAKMMVKMTDLEDNIDELEDQLKELEEESSRTEMELEKENERFKIMESRISEINEQREQVDASSSVSEFKINKELLEDHLESFQRDFGESQPPKRRRINDE